MWGQAAWSVAWALQVWAKQLHLDPGAVGLFDDSDDAIHPYTTLAQLWALGTVFRLATDSQAASQPRGPPGLDYAPAWLGAGLV